MAELGEAVAAELERRVTPIPLDELTPAERQAALPLDVRRTIARDVAEAEGITYRSAMRRLQRYVTGAGQARMPGLAVLTRLAVQRGLAPFRRFRTRATITGLVRVSSDARRRTLRTLLLPEQMAPVLAAYRSGDTDRLEGAFLRAFVYSYGGVPLELETVDAVTLDPVPGKAAA